MQPDLTTEEAQKLFNDVSQAVLNDDSDNKLSSLLATESPQEEEQPVDDTPADEPEDKEDGNEVDTTEESDTPDEDKEEDKSAEKADDKKQEDDPLAKLQAQLDELKKQNQVLSSQAGRVSSIQRQLAAYDKRLNELASKPTSSATNEKVKPKIDEALKDLEDTDPALAKAIKSVMGEALSSVDQTAHASEIEQVQALRDAAYADYQEEQRNILLTKFPNAPQVFGSQHWKDWKKSQPSHIVNLAQSDSAEAVIMALDIYRNDMIRLHPELAAKDAPAKEDSKANEAAAKIEEERKRKQATTANVDSGKAPTRTKTPSDPEALFNQFFKDELKNISGK